MDNYANGQYYRGFIFTWRAIRVNKRIRNNLGLALLAVWLILTGLISLGLSFPGLGPVAGLLAVAAGILLLLGR